MGQAAWVLARSVRVGFGDAGEGDFEAEGFDLADVVGDLAAGGGAGVRSSPGRGPGIACRGWTAACGRPSAGCCRPRRCLGLAAAAGQLPVAGAFAGLGLAGRDGGLAGDGGQVLVAFLVPWRGRCACRTGCPAGCGPPRRPGGRRWGTWSCRRRSRRRRPGRSGVPSRASTRPAAVVPHTGPAASRPPAVSSPMLALSRSMRASIWPAGRRAGR